MQEMTTDGVALQLCAADAIASSAAALQAQQQIYDPLSRQLPVAVTVTGIEASAYAESLFAQVCGLISVAVAEAAVPPQQLAIALQADVLPPQSCWTLRRKLLGHGALYFLLDSEFSRPVYEHALRLRQERFWTQCWQLRGNDNVRIAAAPVISSACPLFPPEYAYGISPPLGLQVPTGSAWAATRIDLLEHCDSRGNIRMAQLRDCVRRSVETGDQRHNSTEWPNAAMCHDGWSNRRLAICIEGIGNLVDARQTDPRSFALLQDLTALLQDIHDTANQHSRQLAAANDPAPGLSIAGSDPGSSGVVEMAGWQARWRAALQQTATRHRNLLALSPWELFPSGQPADLRFADLLPLLTQADACWFAQAPCRRSWNVKEFKHFHRRLTAVLAQKNAQHMIAEQV